MGRVLARLLHPSLYQPTTTSATMPAGAALPGLFFAFAAMVLLVFASVSAPVWNSISFLNAGSGPSAIRFGVFGYTGSDRYVGYHFPDSLPCLSVTTGIVPS